MNTLNFYQGYFNPLIEEHLATLASELTSTVIFNGRQDGFRHPALTQLGFKVKTEDFTEEKIQQSINFIRQEEQPESKIMHVSRLIKKTKVETKEMEQIKKDKERQVNNLKGQRNAIQPDLFKLKYKYVFLIITIGIGIGFSDGGISFSNLRYIFSWPIAFLCALAIAVAISFSHYSYVDWIKQAPSLLQKRVRISIVLAVALLFFSLVACLRSLGIASIIDLSPIIQQTIRPPLLSLSTVAIAGISYVLFIIVFLSALYFWQSKAERKKEELYEQLSRTIEKINQDILSIKTRIEEKEAELLRIKNLTTHSYNYCLLAITRAKDIGAQAVKIYKQSYSEVSDELPDFFQFEFTPTYDEELNHFHPTTESL